MSTTLCPTRLLFLDTEFTSLGDPWPVQLISVGLSDAQGHPLFYAEAADFDPSLAHDFTRRHVIPLLERGAKSLPYAQLCEAFFGAILAQGAPCALAADSDWDWLWIQMMASRTQDASGPLMLDDPSTLPLWPANLSPRMAKISFPALSPIEKMACREALSAHFKTRHPHHALIDAVGNAKGCKAAIEANPGLACDDPSAFCHVFQQSLKSLCWAPGPAPR